MPLGARQGAPKHGSIGGADENCGSRGVVRTPKHGTIKGVLPKILAQLEGVLLTEFPAMARGRAKMTFAPGRQKPSRRHWCRVLCTITVANC